MSRRSRRNERQIDAVARGQAIPEGRLDELDQRESLRAAIDLKAAAETEESQPPRDLAERLRARIDAAAGTAHGPAAAPSSGVSRRAVMTGAVAAGVVGAAGVGGAAIDRVVADRGGSTSQSAEQMTVNPDRGNWVRVASADDLAPGRPVRFATETLIGFVSRRGANVIAVSGTCTHQGCLLHADATAGRLDCPCHRTAFGYDGAVLFSQLRDQPLPLPRVLTRERDGGVEVYAPTTPA